MKVSCTLWTHQDGAYPYDAVFNALAFEEIGLQNGDLAVLLPSGGKQAHIIVLHEISTEQRARYPGLQISISESAAKALDLRNRASVEVSVANVEDNSASHVELTFRDEYLSRADMWRLAASELHGNALYKGQKILFMGTIKATVQNIYVNGKSRRSAYFAPTTKPIFRSESARYVLFVQMSQEMWQYATGKSGDLLHEKVVRFLEDLFQRWESMNARHLVTIVLFTRVKYDAAQVSSGGSLLHSLRNHSMEYKDFYRVVVNEMQSIAWIDILNALKREFKYFRSNVLIDPCCSVEQSSTSDQAPGAPPAGRKQLIRGKLTTAPEGNILEAIALASSRFAHDYIDRDLVRTGISVVIITPGNGIFHVSYDMLKHTTDILIGNGIGIDLVCMSPLSLHSTPLFVFREPRTVGSTAEMTPSPVDDNTPRQNQANFGHLSSSVASTASSKTITHGWTPKQSDNALTETSMKDSAKFRPLHTKNRVLERVICAIPQWIDIGYWDEPVDQQADRHAVRSRNVLGQDEFNSQVRMYDLQMTGIMENQMSDISIPYLFEQLEPSRGAFSPTADRPTARLYLSDEWMKFHDKEVFVLPIAPSVYSTARKTQPGLKRCPRKATDRWTLSLLSAENASVHSLSNLNKSSLVPQSRKIAKAEASVSSKVPLESKGQLSRNSTPNRTASERPGSVHKAGLSLQEPPERVTRHPASVSAKEHGQDGHDSDAASVATKHSGTERPNRTPRQISFGFFGFGAPKASASTALSMGGIQPATGSKASKITEESGKQDRLNQVRASLTRKVSQPGAAFSSLNAFEREGKESNSDQAPVKDVPRPADVGTVSTLDHASNAADSYKLIIPSGLQNKALLGSRDATSSDAHENIPETLLPIESLLPWLAVVNPCNPAKNHGAGHSLRHRWHHVYPHAVYANEMKWKSLCSPAAIPLTNEDFPTAKELATEFNESPYRVVPSEDDEYEDSSWHRDRLVKELIAARLAHGFQIVLGKKVAEIAGVQEAMISNIFDDQFMTGDAATVFMTLGNTIHQILCIGRKETEVRRFSRKPIAALASSNNDTVPSIYKPWIRTDQANEFTARSVSLGSFTGELNWNAIDTFLAGFDNEFSEALRFWRARFVLIPVDVPSSGRRLLPTEAQLSAEEMRLEGIRKLTQLWQQRRQLPSEGFQLNTSNRKRKDLNPLAIEYQTRDPSAVVAAGIGSSLLATNDPTEFTTNIFSENEPYNSSNIDIKKLAQDIQSTKEIPLEDRRWHLKLHYNCFLGSDLTTWLLRNFSDVQTREEAVELGNSLMKQGLFQHVQGKHPFLDGNYFYSIASEYRTPRAEGRTGWFGTRRGDKSVPSTPMVESSRNTSTSSRDRDRSRPKTGNSSSTESSDRTPTKAAVPKPKVLLSRSMRYDVDHRRKSYRQEIITLHYDRLHNPGNCFHIRLEWMNVTPKLIEDCIVNWSATVEKYGLKLVELPIAEATSISDDHPFRAPYYVCLAVPPPDPQPQPYFDATHFTPQVQADRFAYHKALLKKLDFVLDMESASSFPPDVEVTYSWGKPDYRFTQFIHKSGLVLAQITDEGIFALIANRLCVNRAAASRVDTAKFERSAGLESAPGRSSRAPYMSPLTRPAHHSMPDHLSTLASPGGDAKPTTAETIKDDFEKFCADERTLKRFYAEVFAKAATSPSPSPHMTPVLDSSIPTIRLPPSIGGLRDPSPLGQNGQTGYAAY